MTRPRCPACGYRPSGRLPMDAEERDRRRAALSRALGRAGSGRALAERLGVSAETVRRWARGEQVPSPRVLREIENA